MRLTKIIHLGSLEESAYNLLENQAIMQKAAFWETSLPMAVLEVIPGRTLFVRCDRMSIRKENLGNIVVCGLMF